MKKDLVKPTNNKDKKIISLYNAENDANSCAAGNNGQCKC